MINTHFSKLQTHLEVAITNTYTEATSQKHNTLSHKVANAQTDAQNNRFHEQSHDKHKTQRNMEVDNRINVVDHL